MKRLVAMAAVAVCVAAGWPACAGAAEKSAGAPKPDKDGWFSLFNGKDLAGWKVSENPDSIKVVDGVIVCSGPRAHAFYVGPVADANFKNFEFQIDVKTKPKANSGIYFHTEYQEDGWPNKGYECQVNATHSDAKKTGGLYGRKDVMNTAPHKDNEWFTYHIIVKGKTVTIKINGKTTCEYTEPDDASGGRKLSSGTFAIQGHDPESKVLYKNIKAKPLPD